MNKMSVILPVMLCKQPIGESLFAFFFASSA